MANLIETLRVKYQTLPSNTKRNYALGLALAGVLGVTYVLVNTFSEEPQERKAPPRKVQYDILTAKDSRSLGIDQMAANVNTLNKRLEKVESGTFDPKKGKSEEEGDAASASIDRLMDDPNMTEDDLQKLREIRERRLNGGERSGAERPRMTTRKIAPPEPPPPMAPALPPPIAIPDPTPPAPKPMTPQNRIKTFAQKKTEGGRAGEVGDGDGDKGSSAPSIGVKGAKKKNVGDTEAITLPAGSIISGTLITGMDASSASAAKKEPFPALLRVKAEAILPNRFRMDITDCFIVSSGYGDLSSERAYLRAEAISCVRDDGTLLESNIDAYAVGEDGKAGIRGRLVSKEGQLIAKSLMAGFLSGMGNALKPAKVPSLSLNPQTHYQVERPDMGILAQESALGGLSTATNEIAKYYLDMARNAFPVIEVDAGRKVDFIVSRGARLRNQNQGQQRGMGNIATQALQGAAQGALNGLQQNLSNMAGGINNGIR